jgi:hypothetical protein
MTRLSRPSYVGWQGNAGISRRALGEGIMAVLVAGSVGRLGSAHAQVHRPVIVFVHGNFENAGFWQELIWRFEGNDYPADRLSAFELENPVAMCCAVRPITASSPAPPISIASSMPRVTS